MQLQLKRGHERLRRYMLHHGLAHTLFHLAYRMTNSAVMVMVFKVVILARGDLDWSLIPDQDSRWGFLSQDEVRRFIQADPALDLDERFITEAFARGDQCFAFVENGTLGAYTWYATCPTPIQDGVVAEFHPDYVYMHKAFTAPAFRGRRLYGTGVTRAMWSLIKEKNCKGLISCVHVHNQPSQKALRRIGFKTVGRIALLGGRRPYNSWASPGCRSVFRAIIQPFAMPS